MPQKRRIIIDDDDDEDDNEEENSEDAEEEEQPQKSEQDISRAAASAAAAQAVFAAASAFDLFDNDKKESPKEEAVMKTPPPKDEGRKKGPKDEGKPKTRKAWQSPVPSNVLDRCDICWKKDGSHGLKLTKCRDCNVRFHTQCYGIQECKNVFTEEEVTTTGIQCWACQAVGKKIRVRERDPVTGKRIVIEVKERPTECCLCSVDDGQEFLHAMHPVYDDDGLFGRHILLQPNKTKNKPARLAWAHTLCAFMVSCHPLNQGGLYGCTRDGSYGDASDDEGDGGHPTTGKNKIDPTTYVNKRIAKMFDEDVFYGTVTKYIKPAKLGEGDLWHVTYDDDDEEDFNRKELRHALALYKEQQENDPKIKSDSPSVPKSPLLPHTTSTPNDDDDDESVNSQLSPSADDDVIHHFVYEAKKVNGSQVAIKQLNDLQDLVCCICKEKAVAINEKGIGDNRDTDAPLKMKDPNDLRVPLNCSKDEDFEQKMFKISHVNKKQCVAAIHPGCAMWGKGENGEWPLARRAYFFPGETAENGKDYTEPVVNLFCMTHADQHVKNGIGQKKLYFPGGPYSAKMRAKQTQDIRRDDRLETVEELAAKWNEKKDLARKREAGTSPKNGRLKKFKVKK